MPVTLINLVAPFAPELIVAIGAMALLMWGAARDPGTVTASAPVRVALTGAGTAARPPRADAGRIIT